MANANAIVDKMAALGLRHGEKAGVAIATMVFLLCVGIAVSQPTIDTTPEKVKKAAEGAQSNLNRTEDRDAIIKRLEEKENIKPTNFAGTVEEQIKVQLVGSVYTPKREWVSPEPGAGLIRDRPKLIAPSELYAYPGRGGLLVYALDQEGNKIPDKEGDAKEEKQQKYGNTRKPKRGGGMGGGMMGGMGGGQQKKKRGISKEEAERLAKEEADRKRKQLEHSLSGGGAADTVAKAESAADKEEGGPFKQTTKGYRWVAITGTLDHAQMLANYREALKNAAIAHPQYQRLDLERRTLQDDGTWSDWQKVDQNKNLDILDNLPYNEEELAPQNVLPPELVDPLPFLNAGLLEKVHIASLVPKEKIQVEEPKAAAGMGQGMMGRGGNMQNMQQMMQQNSQNTRRNQSSGMMAMMGSRGMSGMNTASGSGESAGNFWKSDERRVMIRALDFTAERDHSYRYRVRIVVYNPNINRDDVSAGTDNKSKTLPGPWSKETDVVTMPPDIQPYALGYLAENAQTGKKARFQVVRFNPADGWTIPHRFDAGIGEVIGEYRPAERVPRSDGSGEKREPVDFRTRQVVLDIVGGGFQNLPAGFSGPPIERPVIASLLRADGSIVVHNQADDIDNEVRKDISANYNHELEQSSKKRKNSRGSGYQGMGGGMPGGGMFGAGQMGGGRR